MNDSAMRMRRWRPLLAAAGLAASLIAQPVRLAAQTSGPAPEAISERRAIKNAREALSEGHILEARRFYEIVAGSARIDPASEIRAEALYQAGMLRLLDDSVNPIDRRGLAFLEEFLRSFPDHHYAAGARAVMELTKRTERAEADAAWRAAELTKTQESIKADHDDLNTKVQTARSEADARTEELKKQIARCSGLEAELAKQGGELENLRSTIKTQEETIAKKNEALRRVRKALVQPRAPVNPSGTP